MISRLLVLGLLLTGVPAVQALDVLPDSYRAAAAAGAIGTVKGRVYE